MKTACAKAAMVLGAVVAATAAQAATILVDLGADTLTTGTVGGLTWNNIDAARLASSPAAGTVGSPLIGNLVDTANNPTNISLSAQMVAGGTLTPTLSIGGTSVDVDGVPSLSVVSPSGISYPLSAYADSAYLNSRNEPSANYYEVTLGGLDGTKSYDIYFLAAASGGSDNGNAKFTVIGNASTNQTVGSSTMFVGTTPTSLANNFLTFSSVVPDQDDKITIQLTSTFFRSNTNSNARWNTMEIVEVPEPASVGLGVLALGSLAGFAWRRRRAADHRAA